MPESLGYCHFCARIVTAGNLGIMIVAARDSWCNQPECRADAKAWQKKFMAKNLFPSEKALEDAIQEWAAAQKEAEKK